MGSLVLAQPTINPGYKALEPNINPKMWEMEGLISLLGSPEHIHPRFDPIIAPFTQDEMFEEHCSILHKYKIAQTTVNLCDIYHNDVQYTLTNQGFNVVNLNDTQKTIILSRYKEIADKYNIKIAVCAPSANLSELIPGILPAHCSDIEWARSLGGDTKYLTPAKTRKGCGCYYTNDWGINTSNGGWKCYYACRYCSVR
jgi:hypothetical protein